MKIHIYEVSKLYIFEYNEKIEGIEEQAIQEGLRQAKSGLISPEKETGCQFVAIIPGGQESKV